jgi:membrane fusion protein, heavy metal efflux system
MKQVTGDGRQGTEIVVLPFWAVRARIACAGISIAFTSLSALSGCDGSAARKQSSVPKQDNPIQVAQVSLQTVQNEVSVPAKVQADPERVVHIYPPVSGRLVSLNVRPGDVVKQGQTVATIESSDATAARTDYEKARIEAERSQQAEKRAELLMEHEVMSQKDYEDIKAQAESAKSDLARTRERLRLLGLSSTSSSDHVAVTAPRPGVVLEVTAANGEMSKSLDNANSIATIADLSSVWVVGDLYEKQLSLASVGTPAIITLGAIPDQSWKGTIANVSDVLDPNTRTLKIRVVLPNPAHKLKPEMFATIHLAGHKASRLTVPTTAVLHEGANSFVMVRKSDGTYEKRSVTIANQEADKTDIASGLQPGETIVTIGAELIRDQGAGS